MKKMTIGSLGRRMAEIASYTRLSGDQDIADRLREFQQSYGIHFPAAQQFASANLEKIMLPDDIQESFNRLNCLYKERAPMDYDNHLIIPEQVPHKKVQLERLRVRGTIRPSLEVY